MTDIATAEQVDTNERIFLETDKVKISSVNEPFPQVSGEDIRMIEDELRQNPKWEDILQVSSPAYCYGGYILNGKQPIVSGRNSEEIFYEHRDLLNDCENALEGYNSDENLKTLIQTLKNLDEHGRYEGKGSLLMKFPFNCLVSFDLNIPYEEVLRIVPVIVVIKKGKANIMTINGVREVPLGPDNWSWI